MIAKSTILITFSFGNFVSLAHTVGVEADVRVIWGKVELKEGKLER